MMKLVDIVKSAPAAKGARVPFDQIDISIHHRPTHADKVGELVQSIRTLELQAAPVVIERDGRYKLVSGRHRLEALRVLEYDEVPVRIVGFDDLQARLWTISEGGHRATARGLGVPEQTIRHATQIAGITPKAKEAALEAGIGDNRLLSSGSRPTRTKFRSRRWLRSPRRELRGP